MKPATLRQLELHAYMLTYQLAHGMPPTLREICNQFGFASTYTAACHLYAMAKKGLVIHRPLVARGWLAIQQQQEGAAA